MSATIFSGELKRTKRYKLGQLLLPPGVRDPLAQRTVLCLNLKMGPGLAALN